MENTSSSLREAGGGFDGEDGSGGEFLGFSEWRMGSLVVRSIGVGLLTFI